ncbi:hypothetical protein psal_cds_413 [Pandoravirus salinus]|uniref:Uncharacterized protein n=1 Tax=Pandoravirus salinus TaxID=1349410 RepID=S4VUC2_9VIRU|nr:hypothetical protein psal_cds_413 [Pandoravirus salinus]AGO84129.1 hypothetical protein psal_cds_413 [Pandoravirus salinus]
MNVKTLLNVSPPHRWMDGRSAASAIEVLIIGVVLAIAAILLQALLVMIFWNLSLPHIFPIVPCLTYGQALWLSLLVTVLF